MFARVLRYVRLPLVLVLIWAVLRFMMQPVFNADYEPRGNAAFSVVGMTAICSLIYGAMSNRVARFNWLGTALVGVMIGLFAQLLIFTATLVSLAAGIDTYFTHWDALNLERGARAEMGPAMRARASGLLFGTLFAAVPALLGRLLFSRLAPRCDDPAS